jgi:hypothetical protein
MTVDYLRTCSAAQWCGAYEIRERPFQALRRILAFLLGDASKEP